MTLNSEAKYSSGGGGEPRGSSMMSLLLTRQHFIGALFTKSKNYIIKRLSSVNATKTKDQKGVNATREIDDDGDSNARAAVRENCVLLCI
jgi:hypothetical protein